MAHKIFIAFLFLIILIAVVSVGLHGYSYYLTPSHERPYREDYDAMKASGHYSHGLGIIGASMIIIGVSTYSSRKRIRALWNLGKLSVWLEFHIFLCLLGPILVVYHTTFKAGGIAAISLWTMLSVWASGLVGRFLYSQIPRNLQGAELSGVQITSELERLGSDLSASPLGSQLAKQITASFSAIRNPEGIGEALSVGLHVRSIRRHVRHSVQEMIRRSPVSHDHAVSLQHTANNMAALLQKSIVLGQVGKIFHYWHAVHLPFTIIMFITLAAHVVAALLLGYTWIF